MSASSENPVDTEEMLEPSNEGESGFGDYEANILQISDTHDSEPYDDILEDYGEGDVDYLLNSGDNVDMPDKAKGFSDDYGIEDFTEEEIDNYIDEYESHFEGISRIMEELGVESGDIGGNHDPILDSHKGQSAYNFKKAVEERAKERYEEFADFDGNLREFILDKYGVEDLHNSEIEVNGHTILGMSDHIGPELDEEVYKFLKEEHSMEDLDYGEEELSEIASYLEDQHEPDYGWVGEIPCIGDVVRYIGNLFGYGEIDVNPEELELDEIPEEFMTEEHQQYLETLEQIDEEYGGEIEDFEDAKKDLIERIEAADGKVSVFHHSTPFGEENQHGSNVLTDVLETHGDQITMVGGGHSHENMVYEQNGVDVVNSAQAYTELGISDNELGRVGQTRFVEGQEQGRGQQDQQEQFQRLVDQIQQTAMEDPGQARQMVSGLEEQGLPEDFAENLNNMIDHIEGMDEELGEIPA